MTDGPDRSPWRRLAVPHLANVRALRHQQEDLEAPLLVETILIGWWLVARLVDIPDLMGLLILVGCAVALRWPGTGLSIAVLCLLFPSPGDLIVEGAALLGAVGVGSLWAAQRRHDHPIVGRVEIFVAALVVTTGIALIQLAYGPLVDVSGIATQRWAGLVVGLAVLPVMVFVIRRGARRAVVVTVAAAVVAVAVGLLDGLIPSQLEASFLHPLLSSVAFDRANGPFPSPNRLGTVAAVAAVAALAVIANDRRNPWGPLLMAVIVVAVGAVLVSYSRGALAGFAVGLMVLVAWRSWKWAFALLTVGVFAAILVGPTFMTLRMGGDPPPGRTAEQADNDAGRVDAWLAGLRMWRDDPITGQGYGSFGVLSADYGGPSDLVTAHNETIAFLAEAGAPAGASYVGLLLACVYAFRRRSLPHEIGLAAIVVFAVASSFNIQSVYPQVSVLVWTMVALGLALPDSAGGGRGQGPEGPSVLGKRGAEADARAGA